MKFDFQSWNNYIQQKTVTYIGVYFIKELRSDFHTLMWFSPIVHFNKMPWIFLALISHLILGEEKRSPTGTIHKHYWMQYKLLHKQARMLFSSFWRLNFLFLKDRFHCICSSTANWATGSISLFFGFLLKSSICDVSFSRQWNPPKLSSRTDIGTILSWHT